MNLLAHLVASGKGMAGARGADKFTAAAGRASLLRSCRLARRRLLPVRWAGEAASEMAIIIEQVIRPTEDGVRALVDHSGQKLSVSVAAEASRAADVLGQSLVVELGFQQVLSWHVVRGDGTPKHGLFHDPIEPGSVRIVGTVHNILALDDGSSLFDVYVQAGPEFLTFASTDLPGQPPSLRDAIEVTVRGLCFYPTWT